MKRKIDIKRAWTDRKYRASLTPEERASLPPNPAGDLEPSDAQQDQVLGGFASLCTGCTTTQGTSVAKKSPT
jgi:mersacidin/lichenicidin family type 2 lantibiotic